MSVVFLALVCALFLGVRFYTSTHDNGKFFLKNNTQEIVSNVTLSFAKSEAYLFPIDNKVYTSGEIKPGDTGEINFRTWELRYKVEVKFSSGRKMILDDPLYTSPGTPLTALFEIEADKIVLTKFDYSETLATTP